MRVNEIVVADGTNMVHSILKLVVGDVVKMRHGRCESSTGLDCFVGFLLKEDTNA